MKRFASILIALSALLVAGCRHTEEDSAVVETPPPAGKALRFASVPVSLYGEKEDGTKSVVSTDVEGFRSAWLFAFDSDGAIYLDGEDRPVALHTASKTFEWTLPLGVEMDILVVVNPGDDTGTVLNGFLSDIGLTKDDLLSLTYTCGSAAAMLSMETVGMPMSGAMEGVVLGSASDPLVFTLRRLYARYDLRINTSRFAASGWSVSAVGILASRSNTEVPFFYTGSGAGFRQSDASKLSVVDYATGDDLAAVNTLDGDNRSTAAATLYFLENCQGDPSGTASKWSNVGTELADEVALCSYIEFSVTASRPGFGERAFRYRLYPGQNADMKSNFDIVRNRQRKISITLDAPTDGFQWTNTSMLRVAPGETITIPFETSLQQSEASFTVTEGGSSTTDLAVIEVTWYSDNLSRTEGTGSGQRRTSYSYYGTVSFKARDGADEGTIVSVKGGQAELYEKANVLVMTDFDYFWNTVPKSQDYYPETQTIEWTSSALFTSNSADYIISHSTCNPTTAAHGSPVTITKVEMTSLPSSVAKRWQLKASMLPWWPGANGFTQIIGTPEAMEGNALITAPSVAVKTPDISIYDTHHGPGTPTQDVYLTATGASSSYDIKLTYSATSAGTAPSSFPEGCTLYSNPDLKDKHDLMAACDDTSTGHYSLRDALAHPGNYFTVNLMTTSFRGLDFDPRWDESQANQARWSIGIRYPHGYVLSIDPEYHIDNPMYGKQVPSTPYEYEVHKGRTAQNDHVSVRNEDASDTHTYHVEYLRQWPKRLLTVDLTRGGTVSVPSGMTRTFDRADAKAPAASLSGSNLVIRESSFLGSDSAMDQGCGTVTVGFNLTHLVSGETFTLPHSIVRVYTHYNAFATFDVREDKNVIRESIMADTFSGTQADGLDDIESWKYNQSVTLAKRAMAFYATISALMYTIGSFGLLAPGGALAIAEAWMILADAPITVIDASWKWNCMGGYQNVAIEKTVPEHVNFAHERVNHIASSSGDSFTENYWWQDNSETDYTYTVGWNRGTGQTYHMVGLEGSATGGFDYNILNVPNWRTIIARNAPAFKVRTGNYNGVKVKKVSDGNYNVLEVGTPADPSGNGYVYLHPFWEGKAGRVTVEAAKLSAKTNPGAEIIAIVGADYRLTLANGWWDPDVYPDGIPILFNKVGMYFFPDAPGDTKRAGMYPYYPGETPWGDGDSSEREKQLYNAGALSGRDADAPKSITEYNSLPAAARAAYNSGY